MLSSSRDRHCLEYGILDVTPWQEDRSYSPGRFCQMAYIPSLPGRLLNLMVLASPKATSESIFYPQNVGFGFVELFSLQWMQKQIVRKESWRTIPGRLRKEASKIASHNALMKFVNKDINARLDVPFLILDGMLWHPKDYRYRLVVVIKAMDTINLRPLSSDQQDCKKWPRLRHPFSSIDPNAFRFVSYQYTLALVVFICDLARWAAILVGVPNG